VNFGDNAQTGGSRNTYHRDVDQSHNKTTYGNNTQVTGTGNGKLNES